MKYFEQIKYLVSNVALYATMDGVKPKVFNDPEKQYSPFLDYPRKVFNIFKHYYSKRNLSILNFAYDTENHIAKIVFKPFGILSPASSNMFCIDVAEDTFVAQYRVSEDGNYFELYDFGYADNISQFCNFDRNKDFEFFNLEKIENPEMAKIVENYRKILIINATSIHKPNHNRFLIINRPNGETVPDFVDLDYLAKCLYPDIAILESSFTDGRRGIKFKYNLNW